MLRALDTRGSVALRGRPPECCFRRHHNAERPCRQCPAASLSAERPGPVSRVTGHDASSKALLLTTAVLLAKDRALVKTRAIPDCVFSELVRGRTDVAAGEAALTPREREVLDYLRVGRSLVEIGIILNISPRTVKFHRARTLKKIGADSQLDLMRVLF